MNDKIKKGIATALLLGIGTVGAITVNVNIDTKKFIDRANRGELYVTSFNMKKYKEVRGILIEMVDLKQNIGINGKKLYWQILNRERPKENWILHDVTIKNVVLKLNEALKKEIKK